MRADVAPATPRAKAFRRTTIFMAMDRTGASADGEAIPGGETRTQEFWRETGPNDRRDPETQGQGGLRTA